MHFGETRVYRTETFSNGAGLVSAVTKYKNGKEEALHHPVTLNPESLTYLDQPLISVTSKFVYQNLMRIKCGEIAHTPRIAKYTNLVDTNWSMYYKIALTIPLDTKTQEFQYKFLHDALVNNLWLKKWEIADSDLCTFCKNSREDIVHLFWQCEYVKAFWNRFKVHYTEVITEPFNLFLIICTLVLLAKRHIYECRFQNTNPDLLIFNRKVDYVRQTEFEIAKRNNVVLKYLEKWELLLP